jgi:SNF family Na+-dependent transporter
MREFSNGIILNFQFPFQAYGWEYNYNSDLLTTIQCAFNPSDKNATTGDYFFAEWTFNWKVFVGVIVVWIIIYLSIFKGVESTGWVVKFLVPLPIIIIVILIVRGNRSTSKFFSPIIESLEYH